MGADVSELPPGFVLDLAPQANALPAGFVLDQPAPQPAPQQWATEDGQVMTGPPQAAAPGVGHASAQGLSRSVADTLGLPGDLVNQGLNVLLSGADWIGDATGVGRVPFRFKPVSDTIANAGAAVGEMLGSPSMDPQKMDLPERTAYEGARFAGGGMIGNVLARALGAGRIAELAKPGATPESADALLRPYTVQPGASLAGDAAAGLGAGTGYALTQQLPEDVRGMGGGAVGIGADLLGMGLGATSAGGAASLARDAALGGVDALKFKFGPALPYDPQTGEAVLRRDVNDAGRFLQEQARQGVPEAAQATAPQAASEAIRQNVQTFNDMGAPLPTSGLIAENPGLAAVEKGTRVRGPTPFLARDNAVRDYAVQQVDSLGPAGANPEIPVESITQQAQVREAQALRVFDEASARLDQEVLRAETRAMDLRQQMEAGRVQAEERIRQLTAASDAASVQEAQRLAGLQQQAEQQALLAEQRAAELRQQAEGVRAQREILAQDLRSTAQQQVPAAQRIDTSVVDQTLRPMNETKRELFNAAEGRGLTVPGDALVAAIQDIRGRAQSVLPGLEGTRLSGQLDNVLAGIERQLAGEAEVPPPAPPPPAAARVETPPEGGTPRRRQVIGRQAIRVDESRPGETPDMLPAGVSYDQINQSRGALNDLSNQARAAGQYQLAESIDRLRGAIGRETEALAQTNPEVGAAVQNFREAYAPVWARGPGDEATKFRRDYNADPTNRTKTPPSQTAGRFLQPAQPERADALARVLEASTDPAGARTAVREYLLGDLAKAAGVVATSRSGDSVINLNAMRKWREGWGDVLTRFPEAATQADDLLQRVSQSDDSGRAVAAEIKAHETATRQNAQASREQIRAQQQSDAAARTERKSGIDVARQSAREAEAQAKKGMDAAAVADRQKIDVARGQQRVAQANVDEVQTDIRSGPTSLVYDKAPDKAVTAVFGSDNPERDMRAIVARLGGKEATTPEMQGWKKAVADHLQERIMNVNPGAVSQGTDTVGFAKLVREFRRNEKVLAEVYTPEEMNALRRAQKAIEPLQNLRAQATVGSPTAENSQLGMRIVEVMLRTKYGALKGGGIFRNLKIGLNALAKPELGAQRLVERAMLDPDVAMFLLDYPVREAGGPAWNSRLQAILRDIEAARNVTGGGNDEQ